MGMKSWTIIGYQYAADQYTPQGIIAALTTNPGQAGPVVVASDTVESHLDVLARLKGIDRQDESSYDSSEFPKVIFLSDIESDDETFLDVDGTYVRFGDL